MNNLPSPGLLALGLVVILVRPAVALQQHPRLYSVPENDPHAVVRLRIGAAVPHWVGDVQLELEEKGGWLVAVDSAGPAQVVFRQASAEITLRVAPGLHVLHFIQYRQAEYPEQGRLPVGSQVDLSAIFEEGGEYAVQLAASKLHRLNCACFVAYRVNGGEVVRSFVVTDDWVKGPNDRSFPSLPPRSTGARKKMAGKLHIRPEYLPASWQDAADAASVAGVWHDAWRDVLFNRDGSAQVGRFSTGTWRQYGNRILVLYGTGIQTFLTVEGETLVGFETVYSLEDETINSYTVRYARGPRPGTP